MGKSGMVTAPVVLQSAAVATGAGVAIDCQGYRFVILTVAGISGDTITVEGCINDSNWEALRVVAVDARSSLAAITANNTYVAVVGGQRKLRAKISTYSAGTITVTAVLSSVDSFPVGYGVTAGGYSKTITLAPTLFTSALEIKDSMSLDLQLSDAVRVSGGGGQIQTIVISDLAMKNMALDLIFFNSDPAGTYTAGAKVDISDADLLKIIGIVEFSETDYSDFTDNSVACKSDLRLAFQASGSADIWMLMMAQGEETFAATDMKVLVTILQD